MQTYLVWDSPIEVIIFSIAWAGNVQRWSSVLIKGATDVGNSFVYIVTGVCDYAIVMV